MATKKEINDRRMLVLELKIQGFTLTKIADQVGVTLRQVEVDYQAIKKDLSIDLYGAGKELLAELKEAQRLRTQRLWWVISDKTSKKSDVLKAVELLQKEEDRAIRRAQLIGILPKDSEFVKADQNIVDKPKIDVYQTLLEISRADEKLKEDIKNGKVVDIKKEG